MKQWPKYRKVNLVWWIRQMKYRKQMRKSIKLRKLKSHLTYSTKQTKSRQLQMRHLNQVKFYNLKSWLRKVVVSHRIYRLNLCLTIILLQYLISPSKRLLKSLHNNVHNNLKHRAKECKITFQLLQTRPCHFS